MLPGPRHPLRRARIGRVLLVVAATAAVAGCGTISRTPPAATAAPFPGIAGSLSQHGIDVEKIASGDAGCNDIDLSKTAIGFDASGFDQTTPLRIHIYIFRNRATYERLRSTVDTCAAAYVTDRSTFESVDESPYVVAGQGPWGPTFRTNLQAALKEAAGTGD